MGYTSVETIIPLEQTDEPRSSTIGNEEGAILGSQPPLVSCEPVIYLNNVAIRHSPLAWNLMPSPLLRAPLLVCLSSQGTSFALEEVQQSGTAALGLWKFQVLQRSASDRTPDAC